MPFFFLFFSFFFFFFFFFFFLLLFLFFTFFLLGPQTVNIFLANTLTGQSDIRGVNGAEAAAHQMDSG